MSNDKDDKRVRTTELIRTRRSWDGAELPDYLKGRPEIVATKYDVPGVTGDRYLSYDCSEG